MRQALWLFQNWIVDLHKVGGGSEVRVLEAVQEVVAREIYQMGTMVSFSPVLLRIESSCFDCIMLSNRVLQLGAGGAALLYK